MKKYLKGLFYFTILALVTTSCSNTGDLAVKNADAVQSYQPYDNHVTLTGEDNMRDLGGFIGENGKPILKHKLFRSGELSALTSADINVLTGLGIKQIIDLRTAAERYNVHDQTINGATNYQLPLIANFIGGSSSQLILSNNIAQGKENAYDYMMRFYTGMSDTEMTDLEAIFDLLETGNTTLLHCNTGKDRTGMATALVLSSLGVDKQTIINDYLASNNYLAAANQKITDSYDLQYGQGAGKNLLPLLEAEQDYITAFFSEIDTRYGSMNNFLDAIKVDRIKMKTLYLEK